MGLSLGDPRCNQENPSGGDRNNSGRRWGWKHEVGGIWALPREILERKPTRFPNRWFQVADGGRKHAAQMPPGPSLSPGRMESHQLRWEGSGAVDRGAGRQRKREPGTHLGTPIREVTWALECRYFGGGAELGYVPGEYGAHGILKARRPHKVPKGLCVDREEKWVMT